MTREHRNPLLRRSVLTGVGSMVGASLLPRTAAADRYGPTGGTRLLVIGDSLIAGGFGLYLARALGEEHGYDVTRRGKSSTGLARPDFFDWMKEAKRLVGETPFDASLVMFGGNDVQGLHMGGDDWIRWPEEGWSAEYARRVAALAELLAPNRQQLFWVGMPVMRPPKFNARMGRVNTIFRAEMAIRRKSKFIDIWPVLADENGDYADRIYVTSEGESEGDGKARRKKVTVRAGDGIHFTVSGSVYLAAHVQAIVHGVLSAGS